MDTLYRHWLILRMIPRKGRISTISIRDRLELEYGITTTLRTVQRDLIALEASKFPLICDNNRPAGWSWRKDAANFDIPNMDPVTALTFKLAEKYLGKMFPHGALAALKPYIQAAGERLVQTSQSHLSTWPDKVKVVSRNLAHISPCVKEGITETVYTALLEDRRFAARYRNIEGNVREYEVNPLGMAFVEGQTYLVATLNDYDEPVLLLIHRILEARMLDTAVKVPEGFDLDSYISRELSFPVGKDIKLKVLFNDKSDVQRLQESPISEDQRVQELHDGRFELTASISDSVQLRWWLRGYGDRVEVLSPKRLRDEFTGLAHKLSDIYQKSS